MSRKLRKKGPKVLELPCYQYDADPRTTTFSRNAIGELHIYQWLVFTSPTGVRIFFRALKAEKKISGALAGLKIAVLGSGTAKALESHGLYPDLMPEIFSKPLESSGREAFRRRRILIPQAALGGPELIEESWRKRSYRG